MSNMKRVRFVPRRTKRSGDALHEALGADLAATLATHVSDYLDEQGIADTSEQEIGELCSTIRASHVLHPDPDMQLEIGARICSNFVKHYIGADVQRNTTKRNMSTPARARSRGWILNADDRKELQALVGGGQLDITNFTTSCVQVRPKDGLNVMDQKIILDGRIGGDSINGEAFKGCFFQRLNQVKSANASRCESSGGVPVAVKFVPLNEAEYAQLRTPLSRAALRESLYVENLVNGLAYQLVAQGISPNLPVIYRIYLCSNCNYVNTALLARNFSKSYPTRYREMIATGGSPGLAADTKSRTRRFFESAELKRGSKPPAATRSAPSRLLSKKRTYKFGDAQQDAKKGSPTELPCMIIVNELAEGGSTIDWLKRGRHSEAEWNSFIFQYLAGLAALQKYYNITHWDTHLGNFLVHPLPADVVSKNPYYEYTLDGLTYYVPLAGNVFVAWDFGMSVIPGLAANSDIYRAYHLENVQTFGDGKTYDILRPAAIILYANKEPYTSAAKLLPPNARAKLTRLATTKNRRARGMIRDLFSKSLTKKPPNAYIVGRWNMDKEVQLPDELKQFGNGNSFTRSVVEDNADWGSLRAGRRVRRQRQRQRQRQQRQPIAAEYEDIIKLAPELNESIGFEIFLPPGRTRARIIGAKNQVHQHITELGVGKIEHGDSDYFSELQQSATRAGLPTKHLTAKRLIGGVIWNDVPSKSAEERGAAYPLSFVDRKTARKVVSSKKYKSKTIVEDDRFRYNPTTKMLTRLVTVFVKRKFGVESVDNVIYQSHFADDKAHWHSMAPAGENITNDQVAARIKAQILSWYKKAMQNTDLFQLGHILHTFQDSFSRSHALRKAAFGGSSIIRFQSFATQDTEKHAGADSMEAFERSPFKSQLISGVQYFLKHYQDYLLAVASKPRQSAAIQTKQLAELKKKLNSSLIVVERSVGSKSAGDCETQYCSAAAAKKQQRLRNGGRS